MIFRSMKSTFRVRGKCFSGCCEMNFRSVENSFQGAGNCFQTLGQTTPARVHCGCPGPQLGGKVVYIKNYIIFSRKNQYIAKVLFRLCFCGVLCTPLAVSDPGVRANYLCPRCSPCLAYTDATRKESGAAPREGTGNQNPITPVDAIEAGGEEIVLGATGD